MKNYDGSVYKYEETIDESTLKAWLNYSIEIHNRYYIDLPGMEDYIIWLETDGLFWSFSIMTKNFNSDDTGKYVTITDRYIGRSVTVAALLGAVKRVRAGNFKPGEILTVRSS